MNPNEDISVKKEEQKPPIQSDPTPTYQSPQPANGTEEDDDHVKRPMNAFMVWSRTERRKLALKYPNMLNCEISKLLGAEWSRMSDEDKQPYIQESKRLRTIHSQKYPDYSYKPRRRKRKAQQNHTVYPAAINFPSNGPVLPPYQFPTTYPKMGADAFRMPNFGTESSYHPAMQDPSKNGSYFGQSAMQSAQDAKYYNLPGSTGNLFPPTSNFPNITMGNSVTGQNHMYNTNAGQYVPPLFKDHQFSGSI